MSEDQKNQLKTKLWKIANTLRGNMNADEFRDYILGFIFYKYLSEKMEIYADRILQPDGVKFLDIPGMPEAEDYYEAIREATVDKLGYFLRPEELFAQIAERGNGKDEEHPNFILDDLARILDNIQRSTMGTESEDDFDHLFEDMDLSSTKLGRTPDDRNKLIAKVLFHLDRIDFKLHDSEIDVLGDAYEYLIGEFASGAGKKAGEFYTPQEVSTVLAKLVTTGKTRLRSVYDPTCGSGSLLLRVSKQLERTDPETGEIIRNVGSFTGQELNRTTYNLARMNMILHDVHYRDFDIRQEDTLERPQHIDERFEAIVANPPFSANWSANPLFANDDRFSAYGKLAPKSKADFAFVQHMIHHLDEDGTMAIVLPHGVLFRGAAEGHIRRYLIEDRNYLDAVIGLPANIFYGTSIPTCILVFKKCREAGDNVIFIDASQHFEKKKTQNYLRAEDIQRMVDTYASRAPEDKYSHAATLEEIEENDYNLNIPRYVDTFEEEEPVDLQAVTEQLRNLENDMSQTDGQIDAFCQELGIENPFRS
ncbi:type I restriction-modification system subunit M (plasmid) [Fulvitalea axinellae]|uniref:site-specific DNA-methyltransferase (adenine-specific) n=1 Tax=Fulvitalea axinellae TaxID=1182444 RepID=A0AAU9DIQ7_9BACT|nr:type I restriction-modification system subunit M [Fulvitalea axinellae]